MVMRGGTSKGAYFVAGELPNDADERADVLLRIMGTPDPRQIDGIGGAHPLTSKVAVVGPSTDSRADIDYQFFQVGVADRLVSDKLTCGNLLAGVGPFALERGLVTADGDAASVRIRLVNGDSIATSSFSVSEGAPVYSGRASISGVPGTASPIRLDFEDIAGSITGFLLPTGRAIDVVAGVECTLIDNGMPVVVMRAEDVGMTGYETCAELEADEVLRGRLEEIRLAATPLMGLGDGTAGTYPKLTLVSPARNGGSLSTRTFIPHACHSAIGVLGAVSVATAAILPGTPANDLTSPISGGSVVLEHPSGSFEALIDAVDVGGDLPTIRRAGVVRTARKLMDGKVFPRQYE